jgi:hypothetical protein
VQAGRHHLIDRGRVESDDEGVDRRSGLRADPLPQELHDITQIVRVHHALHRSI